MFFWGIVWEVFIGGSRTAYYHIHCCLHKILKEYLKWNFLMELIIEEPNSKEKP